MRGSEARSLPLSKMASLLPSPSVWTSSFPPPGFIRPYWLSNIDWPGWEGATRRYVTGSTYKQQSALNRGEAQTGRRGRETPSGAVWGQSRERFVMRLCVALSDMLVTVTLDPQSGCSTGDYSTSQQATQCRAKG